MEKEFVPYTLALELKELGFDEPCFGQFYKHPSQEKEEFRLFKDCDWENRTTSYWTKNISSHFVSTPTYSKAFRWFREKYGLIYSIGHVGHTNTWVYEIINMRIAGPDYGYGETYEETELECLKKLIEIVKK